MRVTHAGIDHLVERYRSSSLARREFFQMLAYATGSVFLAHEIMLGQGLAGEGEAFDWAGGQEQAQPTPKESIAAGEKRVTAGVETQWVHFKSAEVDVGAYLARPAGGRPHPAHNVIHENRGLTEFVLDMAQRWAGEGLLAIAPDCLSRLGGTAKFESMDAARAAIGKLSPEGVMADLQATLRHLRSRDDVRPDKIGVTGFCWGGGQTFQFATESSGLAFAAPFYGPAPALEKLARISCPVFAVYAENDSWVNSNLDAVEARMKELGKTYTRRMFPGTQHAFMNFTAPQRYNAEQARAAWAEVTAFVKKTVG